MTLFDRYIAVDWSAANGTHRGKDSIWVADLVPGQGVASENPPTRDLATDLVRTRLTEARHAGQRVLVGFDFAFGYPKGAARAISGKPGWRSLWTAISKAIIDSPDNRSNRFEVAAAFNREITQPLYWGHPPTHRYVDLSARRPDHGYPYVGEMRRVERQARGAQSVWKLNGAGSVGGQSLTGIPRVAALRDAFDTIAAVWPFETDFERRLQPIVLAEIYPSMIDLPGGVQPKDREQVEMMVEHFAALDAANVLAEFLSAPATLRADERQTALEEEGWIAGAGHEHLLRLVAQPSRDYLRDPNAIYAQSFAIIEAEADLSRFTGPLREIVIRMIHACGMTDITADIRAAAGFVPAASDALAAGAPILCDCEAVRSGIIARQLKSNDLVVTLNDPAVPALASKLNTTRSAAAVELWRDRLANALVVIGNAPTALFHLLDMLAAGAPKPAAIIATPVGFVGAAESKAALAAGAHGVPYITLLGRRGGSAIASAALNAIAKSAA